MTSARVTVKRLITLALNPSANENEARNAAMQACRMIEQHGLLDAHRGELDPFADLFPRRRRGGISEDVLEAMRRQGIATQQAIDDFKAACHEDEKARTGTPPQPSVPGSHARRAKDPEAKEIPVLDAAWCPGCGQRLRRGSFATWSRGEVWHGPCWTRATEGVG